jgi:hypothetical protein
VVPLEWVDIRCSEHWFDEFERSVCGLRQSFFRGSSSIRFSHTSRSFIDPGIPSCCQVIEARSLATQSQIARDGDFFVIMNRNLSVGLDEINDSTVKWQDICIQLVGFVSFRQHLSGLILMITFVAQRFCLIGILSRSRLVRGAVPCTYTLRRECS